MMTKAEVTCFEHTTVKSLPLKLVDALVFVLYLRARATAGAITVLQKVHTCNQKILGRTACTNTHAHTNIPRRKNTNMPHIGKHTCPWSQMSFAARWHHPLYCMCQQGPGTWPHPHVTTVSNHWTQEMNHNETKFLFKQRHFERFF
jgi:hypothetical protein